MGGYNGGGIASSTAAQVIQSTLTENYIESMRENMIEDLIETSIERANVAILQKAVSDSSLAGMGTTVVALIVRDSKIICAHMGDSRCMILSGDKLKKITKDHSYVQELVDRGEITEDEARVHPKKNLITRALGTDEDIQIEFTKYTLEKDEKILVCTDGLVNNVTENEIIEILNSSDLKDSADILVDRANSHGGTDNITALVIA
jgi:protein phosphatase